MINAIGNIIGRYSGGGGGVAIQASNFVLVSFTDTTQTWKFNRGSGNGGCLVVMRANSPVNAFPQNGITYAADLNFGDGDEIGEGNFAVYVDEGSNPGAEVEFTVTGLTPGDIMYVRGFEFNGKYIITEPEIPEETQQVLDLLQGISDTQRQAIINFVNSQVDIGNWALLDTFQVFDFGLGADNRLLDWKGYKTPTNPNGHSFAVGGVDIPGGTSIGGVHTNYNPSVDAVNLTALNAVLGVYVYSNDSNTDQRRMLNNLWVQRTGNSRLDFSINGLSVQKTSFPNGWERGLWTVKLEVLGETTRIPRVWHNDTDLGQAAGGGTPSLPNVNYVVGGQNTSTLIHDGIVSVYYAGAGDGFDVEHLSRNLEILMTALGL